MCEQDSSGIQFKAPLEYLTWPDLDTGNRPDAHDLVGDQFVVRVEEQHAKMLRPLIGYFAAQIGVDGPITRQYRSLGQRCPQHLLHDALEAAECSLDIHGVVEQLDPLSRTGRQRTTQ